MRAIILIGIFTFIFFSTYSQSKGTVDLGLGNIESSVIGLLAIKYIQTNKYNKLPKLFSKNNICDKSEIKSEIKLISKQYPYDFLNFPVSKTVESIEKVCYYERNFLVIENGKRQIVLQIHIELVKGDENYEILNIYFNRDDKVINREDDFRKIEISINNGDAPPPPPPN